MAGTVVADTLQAASTSTLVLKNGVANTPPTIQDSAGTQIGTFCRAWVNFNGTTNVGGFCTIRASFNVSSVADNGVGNYTVNFATAMPDVNYATTIGTNTNLNNFAPTYSTTATSLSCATYVGAAVDPSIATLAIFR